MSDAGSFNMDDAVYQVAHDIAREGDLPLRWEGSCHIWAPDEIDIAAESLLRLRERYSHGKLQCGRRSTAAAASWRPRPT